MNSSLSTKERYLLEDQKTHEQICILKYSNYANLASDPQLKNIFNSNAKIEQEHLNTINQLLKGQVPGMSNQSNQNSQSSGGQQNQSQQSNQTQTVQSYNTTQPQSSSNSFQSSDKDLCTDMLMTEKYVSNTYDTAIFEFSDPQIRNVLNHIQKEEQQHGEAIFKYMESSGMYNPQ